MGMGLKDTIRTIDAAFSYQCHACNKCCHGKGIQVNPYETMRLSSHLKITTTQFRHYYLKGQFLKHKENSKACIFLGTKGCTVHKDRPQVCRLYPLGRFRRDSGEEVFTELFPHPESKGVYGDSAKVKDYLKTQKVGSYLKAEKSYLKLIQKMAKAAWHDQSRSKSETAFFKSEDKTIKYADWVLDPDPVIEKYCQWKTIEFPLKIAQKLKLHIEALNAWADGKWNPVIDNY
tara:strand:+ start:56634 stop:57329 length:696 start_codon:yes stop_codon:yes gene_type:complete